MPSIFPPLFTAANRSASQLSPTVNRNQKRRYAQNAYTGCVCASCLANSLRGACSTQSPWNAEMRLYCGEYANASPVPNGDPAAGSAGYRSRSGASSSGRAAG